VDAILAVANPANPAVCNRVKKELHFLWRKYSLAESRSIMRRFIIVIVYNIISIYI